MRDCNAMDSRTCDVTPSTSCAGLVPTRVGEPDAGNLHVRFEEGEGLTSLPTRLRFVVPRSTVIMWRATFPRRQRRRSEGKA